MKNDLNPWLHIDAKDYEEHMSHDSVLQLQRLNYITSQQLSDYKPEKLLILGIATGNGLEKIDSSITNKIYGVDINQAYLNICNERFISSVNVLKLYNIDLNRDSFTDDKVDLIIVNLVLEYVPLDKILKQVQLVDNGNTVISIVIQKNNDNSFVSETGITSLDILDKIHIDINQKQLEDHLKEKNYIKIKEEIYNLPNGKDLIRIDIKSNKLHNSVNL